MATLAKLVLQFPELCPACTVESGIRLEQVIHGKELHLAWSCSHCRHESPVVERRTGHPWSPQRAPTDRPPQV